MQSIIRSEHDKDHPFIKIAKDTVEDSNLSFEARGFLGYLLTKPDDWGFRPKEMAKECKVHFTTIYRLLNTLIKSGYVQRAVIVRRKDDGTFDSGSIYRVHESKGDRSLEDVPF